MNPAECRTRAAHCRYQAAMSSGELRDQFVTVAENWERLAHQMEQMKRINQSTSAVESDEHLHHMPRTSAPELQPGRSR